MLSNDAFTGLSSSDKCRAVVAMTVELHAAHGRLLQAVAVLDAAGAAQVVGWASTAQFLAKTQRVPLHDGHAMVAAALVERDHVVIGEAHRAGVITERHVAVLATAAAKLPGPVMVDAAPLLVAVAKVSVPGQVKAAVASIVEATTLDDDAATGADERAKDDHARRFLQVATTFDGVVHVTGMLDAHTGALFTATLKALSRLSNDAAAGVRDDRTADQRRVDGLREMCVRLLATGDLPVTGGRKPHLTLVVDLPTLQAHTSEGLGLRSQLAGYFDTTLGPDAARRLTCDAAVTTVVTDQVGAPLAVGRTARTVTTAQHTYLRVRDNGCVFPGCDRPHEMCDAHHVTHWSHGGPTDVNNLVMLCSRHHQFVHDDGWVIEKTPNSKDQFQWRPPDGREPIPAHHQLQRNPLTSFDWACEMAKLRAMWQQLNA